MMKTPTPARTQENVQLLAEIADLRADVKRLRETLLDCERATWLEGQTLNRLSTTIRRAVQKALAATEPKP